MRVLVVGASGATGRRLVSLLIGQGHEVRAVVRSRATCLERVADPRLSLVQANLLEASEAEVAAQVRGCDAVASCLGHSPNLKGIYGPPRRLVAATTQRLCEAIGRNRAGPVRFVLMNSAGVRDAAADPSLPFAQRCLLGVLRHLVPPHADNEQAAQYLQREAGDGAVDWAVVRPVNLTDAERVSAYVAHASPSGNGVFDPAQVSRINVAHFIAALLTDPAQWARWRGRMPVLYNG